MAALQRFPQAHCWVLPAYAPPRAAGELKENVSGFEQRLEMCQLAFGHLARVAVKDVESKLPRPSYTRKTVSFIKTHWLPSFARHELGLLMGLDQLVNLPRWYEVGDLLNEIDLVVVRRPLPNSEDADSDQVIADCFKRLSLPYEVLSDRCYRFGTDGRLFWIPETNVPAASSQLRQQLTQNRHDMLDGAVERYISTHKLYQ